MANKSYHRLSALDGLRGFAIILVFLNHIPTSFILQYIPQWLFGWLFVNGVTGVTFLFLLSGFLMYYIYPNPENGWAFLQKRYTRIFPLFLTMSAVMFSGRQLGNASWYSLAILLVSFPIVSNFLWTRIIKNIPHIFGTLLFLLFLTLQTLSVFLYIFWINKVTFAYFSALPKAVHEGIIYLVNATLTLPFGQYIPMLDGVYWSLASEVLFYILYPILIIPLIKLLLPKSLKIKLLFLVALFFFLGGVHMLSYKIFVLSLVQPALFFYFAAGIILAHIYRNKRIVFKALSTIFSGKLFFIPVVLGFLTVMAINDLSFLGQWISPWVRMLFAIPITFCAALLLTEKTVLQKAFTSKWLIFLGMVSYSIYLSHALTIHIAELLYTPQNIVANIFFIIVVFAAECGMAFYLYKMLEAPYFIKDKHMLHTYLRLPRMRPNAKLLIPLICIIYVLGVFAAYQSKDKFSFFSIAKPISKEHFTNPKLSLSQTAFRLNASQSATLEFVSPQNNIQLLVMHLSHKIVSNNLNPQAILFTISDKGSTTPIGMATYSLDQFDSNENFPFGLPTIPEAQGKTLIASWSATNSLSNDFVSVYPDSVKAVYSANKKDLLTHPKALASFILLKFESIYTSPEALFALVLLIPFVVIGLLISL